MKSRVGLELTFVYIVLPVRTMSKEIKSFAFVLIHGVKSSILQCLAESCVSVSRPFDEDLGQSVRRVVVLYILPVTIATGDLLSLVVYLSLTTLVRKVESSKAAGGQVSLTSEGMTYSKIPSARPSITDC